MTGVLRRVRSLLGAARRGLRSSVDRRLHEGRRRAALSALRERGTPGRVLALCLGNVCRSPYVEAYLEQAVPGLDVRSAGFIGPDRSPPPEALAEARRRGLDTSGHRSRLVTGESVEEADLVLLVDPAHERRMRRELRTAANGTPTLVLGDLDPVNVGSRRIEDPWGQGEARFEEVFDRLDRCLDVLVHEWRER